MPAAVMYFFKLGDFWYQPLKTCHISQYEKLMINECEEYYNNITLNIFTVDVYPKRRLRVMLEIILIFYNDDVTLEQSHHHYVIIRI